MFRRSFLLTSAGALTGCTTGGDADSNSTVNPALHGTPTASPTPTAEPTAYGAGEADSLDRPRSVVVANRLIRHEWATLRIRDGDTTVVDRTIRVPPAGRTTVRSAIGAVRTYTVRVQTADGRRRTVDWTPSPGGDDLEIDLDSGVSVRETYPTSRASAFVEGTTGELLAATPATTGAVLVVDAPGKRSRVRITASDGSGAAGIDLRVPARTRLPVPLSVPQGRIAVAIETADGSDRRGWRPFEDGPLFCLLGSTPRLVCDRLIRDVVVENPNDVDAAVDIAVRADDDLVLDRTVYPPAGGTARLRAAVPPAGTFLLAASHDGTETSQSVSRCPARGPFVVRLATDGIAIDSRPVDESRTSTPDGEYSISSPDSESSTSSPMVAPRRR